MKRILFPIIALLATLSVTAQSTIVLTGDKKGDTHVIASNTQVAFAENRTMLSLDFILDSLRVSSNRYRAFTPVIVSKNDSTLRQRMKTLIVSGRTQDIVFEREGIDPFYADNYVKVRRYNDTPQTYSYTDGVDRQPWHRNADIYVECDLCGCADQKNLELAHLYTLKDLDPYDLIALADVVPAPSKKERNLHGSAYITFIVDKWDMKPDYMNNRAELRKITDTLDVMVADPNVSVRQVKIHGWASPESPYEHNRMLAENRAKSLTEYVKHLYSLPDRVFAAAEATPENWIGLRAAVVDMSEATLPHKEQIMGTIDKVLADLGNGVTKQADRDELSIRSKYPEEYRYLLQNVYPGLRRSDYEISFNFSDFTLEQAKEIYKTKPYQLSLREMWDVAGTMEPYGPEYNKVMQTAVNVYPDAPEALINLANVAIRQKDLLKAESLLDRAGDRAEAQNARAVIAIIQKRYADAERLLSDAARKGLDVSKNREAIQLLK